MKNFTQQEIASAKKIAYSFAYSYDNILLNKKFTPDRRTRLGKLAIRIFKQIQLDKKEILNIKAKRKNSVYKFERVIDNPLVKDYMKNKKHFHVYINADHLSYPTLRRNHYAKNQHDFLILATLRASRNRLV